ncbi:auxin-induced in root cultures protein 12-like [Mercurialis annua]|uniref:auxin-induced in root cultures protein 12-like n=1 Tax=Mercurialis annua TaxID=3986 RepID=UPI0021609A5B|nr:auxin-induced in root cultures protein 12-like [Mercurialis annua]
MALINFKTLYIALILSSALLISPSVSLTCNKQKFKSNKLFANCTDLPVLNSFLHFTYNNANSSLSIAFVAPPAKLDGWVAWAINPTSTGMIGSQALLSFKSNDGLLIVKTFNISSHDPPQESKLSFDVWDIGAESYEGNIVIFATVKVPKNAERLNQVWQVGSAVSDSGVPEQHEMADANMNSKGVLELVAAASTPGPSQDKSGSISTVRKWNSDFIVPFFALITGFVAF